jgi:FKBP-type peptidyl-prolyl cis-trans isomerase
MQEYNYMTMGVTMNRKVSDVLKRTMLLGIGLLLISVTVSAEEPLKLTNPTDMINYSIGVEVIRNFRKQGTELNIDLVIRGINDAYSNEKLLLTDKEIRKAMNSFQAELRRKQAQNTKIAAEENKKAGSAFMAENKKQEGVVTLPSGVQYTIIKQGNGRKPVNADTIEVNYQGTLIDGTEFDSTEPGQPATLKLSQLIAGWKEALKLMPVGSRWQIVVPPQLAYGQRGAGSIGPNATLLFEVELVAIK